MKNLRMISLAAIAAAGLLMGHPAAVDAEEGTEETVRYHPEEVIDDGQLHEVQATAYIGSLTSTGRVPTEGLTVAGPKEWIGCTCVLYDEDKEFLGFYEFMDVGYGKSTGTGRSRLPSRKGQCIGTIETGEWIDLYFDTLDGATRWGKRTVYIQVIRAEG